MSRKQFMPLNARRNVRINLSIATEGTAANGDHILRLSGSYLEVEGDSCEFLVADECVVTDSPEDVFLQLSKNFRRLVKS